MGFGVESSGGGAGYAGRAAFGGSGGGGVGDSNSIGVKTANEVPSEIATLARTLEHLQAIAASLLARIEPVLLEDPNKQHNALQPGALPDRVPPRCQLSREIATLTRSADQVVMMLQNAHDRVAL